MAALFIDNLIIYSLRHQGPSSIAEKNEQSRHLGPFIRSKTKATDVSRQAGCSILEVQAKGMNEANDYGGPKIFHEVPDPMAEDYGEKACQQKIMAIGAF